jgi:hypothetical protein
MAEIVRSKPTVKDANEAILEGSTSNIRGKVLHTINSPSNSPTDDADTDDYEHNDGKDLDETEPRRTLIRYVSRVPIMDLVCPATHQYSISPYTAIPGILRSSRTTQKTIDIAQVGMF